MWRACAVALLVAGCGSSPRPAPSPATQGVPAGDEALVSASLQRTACYGTCPVYQVTVSGDGTVVYEGERFVKLSGRHEGKLTAEQIRALSAAFQDAGFWALRDAYTTYEVTDHPSATISYATATRVKRIEHYYGDSQAPAALSRLESEFDRIVNVEQWIGATAEERQQQGQSPPRPIAPPPAPSPPDAP